ncbi:MAG: hypothetical protein ACQEXE_25240 [Bacillota bacterium]|uniref:Uncharacterized protein n=2 Tax=Bacillaceae TaxID=186817 RepID=A0A160MJ35_9BACI|nr:MULTISPECIES: hypothetical protein [Bacillaceae]AND42888.1 hypothetical protein A361_27280 [Cytobacillus oceanisediminis 2691]MBN8202684.1 hypothetical protein [Bacillus sp. NTK034]UQX56963.1 hypothetical protein M5V91_29590 [Cytobacillus pseudoceanisediminis]USK47408.1 hypothetical protein LIT27_30000 [Cytobacillus oceanisediminis]
MVIQENMSSKAIVEVWEQTTDTFNKYNIPISDETLETLVNESTLSVILKELNAVVGSSSATCIDGG